MTLCCRRPFLVASTSIFNGSSLCCLCQHAPRVKFGDVSDSLSCGSGDCLLHLVFTCTILTEIFYLFDRFYCTILEGTIKSPFEVLCVHILQHFFRRPLALDFVFLSDCIPHARIHEPEYLPIQSTLCLHRNLIVADFTRIFPRSIGNSTSGIILALLQECFVVGLSARIHSSEGIVLLVPADNLLNVRVLDFIQVSAACGSIQLFLFVRLVSA